MASDETEFWVDVEPEKKKKKGKPVIGELSKYKLHYKIGEESGYCEIILGSRKSDGKLVTIKKIPKSGRFDKIGLLPKEYVVMRDLDHPNVNKVYDLEEDKDYFYIIMKYYEAGDLNSFLVDNYDHGLPPVMVLHIAKQLVNAVVYCHQRSVVHRDINIENILISGGSKDMPNIVLSNFGLSSVRPVSEELYDTVGSEQYYSPEMLIRQPYYGVKADVWAVGICLYILFTGLQPFRADSTKELYTKIFRSPVFQNPMKFSYVSNDCKGLIKWILAKDPALRPNIKDIQDSDCFTKTYAKQMELIQCPKMLVARLNGELQDRLVPYFVTCLYIKDHHHIDNIIEASDCGPLSLNLLDAICDTSHDCFLLAAIAKGIDKPVAYLLFTDKDADYEDKTTHVVYIDYMCTSTKYRGKAIGQLLLSIPIGYAIQQGIRYVTAKTNKQSGPLFKYKFKFIIDADYVHSHIDDESNTYLDLNKNPDYMKEVMMPWLQKIAQRYNPALEIETIS